MTIVLIVGGVIDIFIGNMASKKEGL